MAEILKIKAGEEPSLYTNHVLIEQTISYSFRGTGASNKHGEPDYFVRPNMHDLSAMLKAAVGWADDHQIPFIHVRMNEPPA